jgi:hypothetical protein
MFAPHCSYRFFTALNDRFATPDDDLSIVRSLVDLEQFAHASDLSFLVVMQLIEPESPRRENRQDGCP